MAVMLALADIFAYPLFITVNVITPEGLVEGGALYLMKVILTCVPDTKLELEVFWRMTRL